MKRLKEQQNAHINSADISIHSLFEKTQPIPYWARNRFVRLVCFLNVEINSKLYCLLKLTSLPLLSCFRKQNCKKA